jgi:hypothetical protein
MRVGRSAMLIAVLVAPGAVAHAEPTPSWHAGVEVRAELGMHPARLAGGLGFGRVDTTIVLDPLVLLDGQHDLDTSAGIAVGSSGWRIVTGWRLTTFNLSDGIHAQHRLLAGMTAPLPPLASFRATFGVETSLLIVRYGGGVETTWLSLSSGQRLLEEFDASLFLRIEYESPF